MQAASAELQRLARAAKLAAGAGLEVHAGHGLDYETAAHLAALPQIRELNIGHVIIGEAIFVGLKEAISRMRGSIARGVAACDSEQAQQQQQQ
jgi:pyridoxine 5-phosphate synthase